MDDLFAEPATEEQTETQVRDDCDPEEVHALLSRHHYGLAWPQMAEQLNCTKDAVFSALKQLADAKRVRKAAWAWTDGRNRYACVVVA